MISFISDFDRVISVLAYFVIIICLISSLFIRDFSMKPTNSKNHLKIIVKLLKLIPTILWVSFIIFLIIAAFVYKHAYGFPTIFLMTQGLIVLYCSRKFQFFKIDFKDGEEAVSPTFLFYVGYMFLAYFCFYILMDLVILAAVYLNPSLDASSFKQNYLFVYPFLFFYDTLLISLFYYVHKNATTEPSNNTFLDGSD